MDMWEGILGQGYDDIIYIPMSSGLSESCNSAKVFAEDYDGRVEIADNHRISVTMEQSVYDALKYAKQGMNAFEIKEPSRKRSIRCQHIYCG